MIDINVNFSHVDNVYVLLLLLSLRSSMFEYLFKKNIGFNDTNLYHLYHRFFVEAFEQSLRSSHIYRKTSQSRLEMFDVLGVWCEVKN